MNRQFTKEAHEESLDHSAESTHLKAQGVTATSFRKTDLKSQKNTSQLQQAGAMESETRESVTAWVTGKACL